MGPPSDCRASDEPVSYAHQKIGGNALQSILSRTLIACLFATSVFADSSLPEPSLIGVWTGHIGNLPITACFNGITPNVSYGSYYYQRRLVPIDLYGYPDATGKVATWKESDGKPHPNILEDYDGVWQIEPLAPNRIHGTWSNRGGSKKLPIELTKVEYATGGPESKRESVSDNAGSAAMPCSSDIYHSAIEKTVDTFVGPVLTKNNVKYRIVARGFPGRTKHVDYTDRALFISTVELIGDSPSIQSINDELRWRLSAENEAELIACRRANYEYSGSASEESYYQGISSVSIAAHRLAINILGRGGCGERGIWSDDTLVWNLETGKQETLFPLFSDADTTSETYERLPDALEKLIITRLRQGNNPNRVSWDEIQECYGPYEPDAYTIELKLAANGIIFEIPQHNSGTCGVTLMLTFEELRPFLNKEGRQFASEIRATQKARR